MDNNNGDGRGGSANLTNSRYYLIVVQYIKSVSVKKLASEL
jgi:hypothetical protein